MGWRQRILAVAVPALCGILVATGLTQAGALGGPEQDTIDARFRIRDRESPPHDVVLVALEDQVSQAVHARFLDRLRRAQPKVIVYDFEFKPPYGPADEPLIAALGRAAPLALGTPNVTSEGQTPLFGATGLVEEVGVKVGVATFRLGPGGVYNRVWATERHGLPRLPTVAAELAGAPVHIGDFDADGSLIDYAGGPDTVHSYAFEDVRHGRVRADRLRGKVVVVGGSDPNSDRHPTPVSGEEMSGAEIHANAISTILRDFPLRDADPWLDALLLLALSLGGAAAGRRWGAPVALAAGAGGLVVLGGAAQLAFAEGLVIATVAPALGLGVSLLGASIAEQRAVRRERARLAELVRRLAPGEDPERVLERVAGKGEGAVLLQGARFGEYRIGALLGLGAMGVVYRARHEGLDRQVAIKLLAPALAADERIRERLRREALNAARLDHPNVVAVLDAGSHAGRAYIAMQLVEGRALHDLVGTPQLTTTRIAAVVADVAAGLDHAHERGVVHRDVKPQNILVEDATGRALLADFGIAAAAGQERLTHAGDLVGTVAYAAPEQLSGAEPDRLVDVYALGCVLYELLTGRLPFECATLSAAIQAHLTRTPPLVSAERGELRASGIDEVVARALAKVPADRWPTAGALAGAAGEALAAAPAHAATAATRAVSDPGEPTRPA